MKAMFRELGMRFEYLFLYKQTITQRIAMFLKNSSMPLITESAAATQR